MAKVMVIVRFTLMPISSAASRSSETARMALPVLDLEMNRLMAIMMTTMTARVTSMLP